MKPTKQLEKETLKVYDTWLQSYLNGDVKTYDSFFDDAFHFIGSTHNEEFLDRKHTTDFFEATGEQFAGKTQLRNETKIIEQFGELVFITHLFDAWFLGGVDWTFYGRFRFSNILKKDNAGWRFVYQHYSVPDSKAQEGETIGYNQVSAENQMLREAVQRRTIELEEKNRELAIEAALEKVRSRSMAMQKSEELAEISFLLDSEVRALGIETRGCAFNIYGDNESSEWFSSEQGTLPVYKTPRESLFLRYYQAGQRGEIMHIEEFEDEACTAHYEYLCTLPVMGDALKDMIENGGSFPTSQIDHVTYFKYGYLLFITLEPVPEAHDIFKRFTKVFEQTYTRFLDLQKAEAQARESEIELALERVRSRSMGMQKSDELREAGALLFNEITKLGIESITSGYVIMDEEQIGWNYTPDPSTGKIMSQAVGIPHTKTVVMNSILNGWKNQEPLLVIELNKEETISHQTFVAEESINFPISAKELIAVSPTELKLHNFNFEQGYLLIVGGIRLDKEQIAMMMRFTRVFQQTYTRFLDLQKAEAQARESEIELALERVRARSMGMQKSEELKEVIKLVYDQFLNLNIHIDHAGFIVDYKPKGDWHFWIADKQEIPSKITHPYFDSVWANQFDEAKEKGRDFFAINLNFEEKNKFYKVLLNLIPDLPEEAKDFYFSCPGLAGSTVLLDNVGLYIENFDCIPYSDDENATLMRFGKVFQQTYTRFLDLQKAEAQARESEIELALERVRARTMAMQHSDELQEAAILLFKQVENLGISVFGCGFNIWDEGRKAATSWMAGKDRLQPSFKTSSSKDIFSRIHKAAQKGETLFVEEQSGKALESHYKYMASIPEFKEVAEKMAASGLTLPDFQIMHCAFFSHGYLMFISFEPAKDAYDIFKRFAKVFQQTYTRFLDLKKAEAQAKEAKIEAALEKVRSRTMAMQKGEEVKDVVVLLYKELIKLGVTNFATCGYVEINEATNRQATWVTNPGGDSLGLFHLPLTGDDIFDERYKAWKNQQPVFHQSVAGEIRKKHLEYAITTFNSKEAEEMVMQQFPDPTVFYCFNFSHGYLHLVAGSHMTHEEETLLARFTKVFEQTYTRFLDLQKSEAQARESEIELALERVRARTMAMQKSEELAETASVLFQQIKNLGFDTWSCGFCIWSEQDQVEAWMGADSGKLLPPMLLPYKEEKTHNEIYKSFLNGDSSHERVWEGEELKAHYDYMQNFPSIKAAFDVLKEAKLELPTYQCYNVGFFKYGYLLIITKKQNEELKELSIRFSKVFEQTYTRFLDLQKAEAQTREAQIEAALEKVRSRTMAMQKSEELPDAANVLFHQVQSLGIPAWSAGYNILAADKKSSTCIMSSEGEIQVPFELPLTEHSSLLPWYKAIKKGLDFFVYEQGGDELVEHYNYMATIPGLEQVFQQFKDADISLPVHQINHLVRFTNGFLLFITYEPVPHAHDIFKRFGRVFEQTYTRFLDLQKAEAQAFQAEEDLINLQKAKKKAEDTLSELQETQKQLIQAEKMASLGELTAGIAHEIQNPLNFVNNFSEVSKELLEEMMEELANGDTEEVKEIANDIIQNLEKINHHGKRADGIVKGMLQHSRSSSGVKEPTDINALADEYLRLAYHGLRAKDKSFNATLDTDFDESIDTINIISQDIGRVILNLITNAFYVVDEKKKSSTNVTKQISYEPTVSVSTKKLKGNVLISVKDNGNGIPQKVLDKIFQPFFTTKPTGQGTGLGLSLSYDIIKAHGGEITLNTKENEGTEFTIVLPI
ncbi:ATP-binding protein [Yeosuana marina]|uniref:ATP-binding protein n=1 Tax=Yeosuana marina TaxID=1565536 RepID=UPI00141F82BC|nr:ATP-binding protein [Yeosuana marina]